MRIYEILELMMKENIKGVCVNPEFGIELVIEIKDRALVFNKELSKGVHFGERDNSLAVFNSSYLNAEWKVYDNFSVGDKVTLNEDYLTIRKLLNDNMSDENIKKIIKSFNKELTVVRIAKSYCLNYKYVLDGFSDLLFSDEELIKLQ